MFQEFGGLGPAELIGILAAIVILLVAFGSLLAMGLPILVALFGIGIGLGLVELLSHVIATPDFATQLASMIGLGVGIDYALFIVTRYRQGLAEGFEPEHAVVRAIDTAGRAVVFAGCTVIISLLGLFLMGVDFVNGMAVGTSVTVAVVMLASITLLPAVLGFAGRAIDRFSHPAPPGAEAARAGPLVPVEPGRAASPLARARRRPRDPDRPRDPAVLDAPRLPRLGGNPTTDTTRHAYDLVADGLRSWVQRPAHPRGRVPEGHRHRRARHAGRRASARRRDVAAVSPPSPSPSGDAAVIRVIPRSSPQSQSTTDLVADAARPT